jgi:hypothetical protein
MLTLWGKEGYGWSPIVEAGKGVSTVLIRPTAYSTVLVLV